MEATKRIATNNIIMFSDGEITQLSQFADKVASFDVNAMDSNRLCTMIEIQFAHEIPEVILKNAIGVVRTAFDSLTVPMTAKMFADEIRQVIDARADVRESDEFSALKARMNRI